MDRQSLRRLASQGIAAYPPSALRPLADWCWDHGEATGDARYSSLWKLLSDIADVFEDEGGMSSERLQVIDRLLQDQIPAILDADSAESGAQLARGLRQEVFRQAAPSA